MDKQAYSVAETAASLGLSRDTINKLVRTGELASRKVGTRRLILAASVATFLAGSTSSV
jgi:excisionase family DNA binding protein